MGIGAIELSLFFNLLLLGGLGGVGLPQGIPPAPENPLMLNVAPEDCLFYSSWAAVAPIDPDGNATEQWMAQPELQASFYKLKSAVLQVIRDDARRNSDPPEHVLELMIALGETLLEKDGVLFVTEFEPRFDEPIAGLEHFDGGLIFNLDHRAGDIQANLDKLLDAWDEDLKKNLGKVEIAGNTWRTFAMEGSDIKPHWVILDNHLWLALSEASARQMIADAQTDPPNWLVEIRQRMPIDRMATTSYLNVRRLTQLADGAADELTLNILRASGLMNITQLAWTTGLNERGFESRTRIDLDGEPSGLFELFADEPIRPQEVGRVDKDAMFAFSQRMSPQKMMDFIWQMADLSDGREVLEWQIEQFEQTTGVLVREDLINSLGSLVTVYGTPNMLNPTDGWVAAIQVKQEMVFREAYDKLIEFAENEQNSGMFELSKSERGGKTLYSLIDTGGLGLFGIEPCWCLDRDELVFSLNRGAVSRHVRQDADQLEDNIVLTEPVSRLFQRDDQPAAPTGFVKFDVAQVIQLAVSAARSVLPEDEPLLPELNFFASDIPSAEVLTRGVAPFAGATFRTETGFEIIQEQTLPGGSPASTLTLVAGITLPAVPQARVAAQRTDNANRLRQMIIAMHNYHDVNGAFPPAYSTDKDGNPLLSWRVLILPYLEQNDLYEQFHLDEPWDSEHNRELVEQMPRAFENARIPSEEGQTMFLALTGTGTLFGAPDTDQNGEPNPLGTKLADVMDGTSRTLALVEANPGSAVTWTAPEDFDTDAPDVVTRLIGNYPNGTNFAFADGSIRFIDIANNLAEVKNMFTQSGGEVVDLSELLDW